MTRRLWIEPTSELSVFRQCELAGVVRSTLYAKSRSRRKAQSDLLLCRLLDEEYTRHPFYGSRRMVAFLNNQGYRVNRKRVRRLMRHMGLAGMAPGPNTSRPHPEHKKYPYLLRGLDVKRPNQVWSTDISYVRLARGFAYLVAIIDWYSRKVLSWKLSNSMDTSFCVDSLEEAMRHYGKPEIFNSDQGAQVTSTAFTDVLKAADVKISMDGRGRALDNIFVERLWRSVKHEDIYINDYTEMKTLRAGLTAYFLFYNSERFHQSLSYKTPDFVYQTEQGGGAKIKDKYETKNSKAEKEESKHLDEAA